MATKKKSDDPIHIKAKNKGLLHKKLGVAEDKPIPLKKIDKKLKGHPSKKLKEELVFAKNAKTKFK